MNEKLFDSLLEDLGRNSTPLDPVQRLAVKESCAQYIRQQHGVAIGMGDKIMKKLAFWKMTSAKGENLLATNNMAIILLDLINEEMHLKEATNASQGE